MTMSEQNTSKQPDTPTAKPRPNKFVAAIKKLPKHIRFWGFVLIGVGAFACLYPPLITVGTAVAAAGASAVVSGQVAATREKNPPTKEDHNEKIN